jgi:molybdopterin-guanine dinucleotide biosynthesis protein A
MGDERWGIVLAGGEGDRMSRPPLPAISGGRPLAMITTGLPAVEPTGLEECSVEA